ncbi:hypothetical protein DNK47_02490 [Mycoplasma wenyonii]|uniref:Uncharacterized protein n=1 Tax=Mycoplasma wenyonii TaxID=65123 RepID=A0A328PRH7_9MOLU|nr:hypothetical protein [Mycoplasma wenyonii]RAO94917.1 hypothetical protein DNK47_02490 [Mycoplasma wenyonii]
MKLSISAVPKRTEGNSQICFPIVLYLESEEEDSSSPFPEWSPSAFPFSENEIWDKPEDIVAKHTERMKELFRTQKEIGYFYPEGCFVSLDRDLFCHYLLAGCKPNRALQRLLKNIEFELTGLEKFQLYKLLSGGKDSYFEVKNSSNILELSEKLRKLQQKNK